MQQQYQQSQQQQNRNTVVSKLVLLGDVFVGKTSIALRFAKDEFSDFQDSTVGAVFLPHAIEINDIKIKFDIWDTAGQERFRSLTPMYYKGSKAAIVVYDITVQDTFRRAKEWISELREKANVDIVIGLVGNKVDLEESRQISKEDAQLYCEQNGLIHFEVSAKKDINIKELFITIAQKIPLNKNNNKANATQLNANLKVNQNQKRCYCM